MKRGKIVRFVHKLWMFIGRVWAWAPYLWHDFEGDYGRLLRLMQFKIKRMREHIAEHNIIMDAPEVCRRMRITELIIERILNSDYCDYEYAQHLKRWGEIVWVDDKDTAQPEHARLRLMTHANVKTEEDAQAECEEMRGIAAKSEYMERQDYDMLWKYLSKYMRRWWD